MPVPSAITDLSTVAASNYPAGTDSPSTLDDVQRAHASFIAQLRDGKGFSNAVSLASAATTDIGSQSSQFVEISGTVTITSLGTTYNGPRYLRFTGILTLTYNATSLILPGAASIITAAGDTAIAVPNQALNGWTVYLYQRNSGTVTSVANGGTGVTASGTTGNVLTSNGTIWTSAPLTSKIQPITASVAASALTVTLDPTTLDFRSATLTSGTVTTRTVAAAISVVVPSTATLGTINAVQSNIMVLAIDNAGTVELAVVNLAGGNDLTETGVISTTAISAGSTSASVVYSTTARTSVPYRVVGMVRSTQATAGTWATAPSLLQGYGGQALAAMSSLGYGQTWQDLTSSRAFATTYYNTTGKPIMVAVSSGAGAFTNLIVAVNGVTIVDPAGSWNGGSNASRSTATIIVPSGSSYSFTQSIITPNGTTAIWFELR